MGIGSGILIGIGIAVFAIVLFFFWLIKEDNERESGAGGDNPDV